MSSLRAWSNKSDDYDTNHKDQTRNPQAATLLSCKKTDEPCAITCPSCGHKFFHQDGQGGIINDVPCLPAGVKFDPSDSEILMHLEAKALSDKQKLHPLIDEFIPTLEGDNGICYTHPQKLPGVNKDGQVRHFFHRPSKAYTTGTRKRRKVSTDEEGNETRWHKTGKTRPIYFQGTIKGFKKILVLYTNYGRQRKPEKTNWVMHQYHLGHNEEEKEGELVVSKVFYQTQPRQCGSNTVKDSDSQKKRSKNVIDMPYVGVDYNELPFLGYEGSNREASSTQLIANLVVHGEGSSCFGLASDASKWKT